MIHTVRGGISNHAIADMLINFFKKHPEYEGNLFLGFPVLPTSENRINIDAMLISPQFGIVAIHFYEDIEKCDLEDVQDNIYNLILSKLTKESALVKRGNPIIDFNVISFAPNWNSSIRETNYIVCNNDESLLSFFNESFSEKNKELYDATLNCIQSIGTIKKVLAREKVNNSTSKGAILKELEKKIKNLDKIQLAAALETVDGVQRIRGLAGSGKTVVLALKAAYFHVNNPTWDIVVTFNTRSLKQQFKDLISRFTYELVGDIPNWDKLKIIHAWGSPNEEGIYYNFCTQHGIEYYDFNTAKNKSSYETAFDFACSNALIKATQISKMYDVILVDEAQDFSSDFLRICYSILSEPKRLVYAYDELQSLTKKMMASPEEIFGKNKSGQYNVQLRVQEDKPKEDIILKVCYRNSRPILATAHALGFRIYGGLIQMFDECSLWKDIGYEVVKGELKDNCAVTLARTEISSPRFLEDHTPIEDLIVFREFANAEEQANFIAKSIKKNLEEDELDYRDILVIHTNPYTTARDVGIIRNHLAKLNINSHLAGVNTSPDDFFMDKSITFTSIYRAKGNEAAMVYVVDSQYCGHEYVSATHRNILFTAITRSSAWVRVTGHGYGMNSLLKEYEKIKQKDFVLEFERYPDDKERQHLNIIHRDKTADEQNNINRNLTNLSKLLGALETGEMYAEDIPEELMVKLKEFVKNE